MLNKQYTLYVSCVPENIQTFISAALTVLLFMEINLTFALATHTHTLTKSQLTPSWMTSLKSVSLLAPSGNSAASSQTQPAAPEFCHGSLPPLSVGSLPHHYFPWGCWRPLWWCSLPSWPGWHQQQPEWCHCRALGCFWPG